MVVLPPLAGFRFPTPLVLNESVVYPFELLLSLRSARETYGLQTPPRQMTIEVIKAVREDTTREPMRSTAARQREALESVCAGLRPGEPLPDQLAIVVVGSNNHRGNFVLRPGIDDAPIGLVTTPGKSAAMATDLTLETEILKMFGRLPRRGDTLSGAFVEDIRAAGFDVLFAPTPHNPFHVRIVAKTHTFDAAGREALALAFDRMVRQR